ncbi:hypothetical protein Salat_0176500 [Sesamum alatum]|uniref:Myb/SANT-like domain-containing protein n=1 Tax=Sesamum alatum TaxID=300844 RepID=A0AAE2CXQ0_9LAMI|nr:hypothetical protein Salat_0176500 [Sesamum alatum]
MYNELCLLFEKLPEGANDVIDADKFDLNAPPPTGDVVPLPQPTADADNKDGKAVKDDDLDGSSSDADSVLPLPGVPRRNSQTSPTTAVSPPSFHSVGAASSSASSVTPLKRKKRSKERDTCFINSLAWQAKRGRKQTNPEEPDLEIVNENSPIDFGLEFFASKLDLLRQRFTTFRRILQHPSFLWNVQTNRVLGSKEAWAAIIQICTPEGIKQDEDVRLGQQAVEDVRLGQQAVDLYDFMFMQGKGVRNELEIVDLVTSDDEETK